jgi:hypothetical protein
VCAARVYFESTKLLLTNVYIPYEDEDENIDEFVNVLALVEDLIYSNSGCHLVLGGDFNVDLDVIGHTRLYSMISVMTSGLCQLPVTPHTM